MFSLRVEDYVKDLPDELQERARKCRSISELLDLAEESDIELGDDILSIVAGGSAPETVEDTSELTGADAAGQRAYGSDRLISREE